MTRTTRQRLEADHARAIYWSAVSAVVPSSRSFAVLPSGFGSSQDAHVFLVGVGKAAIPAASALEQSATVERGIITVPAGYKSLSASSQFPLNRTRVIEGDHPYPGNKSRNASDETIGFIETIPQDAPVVVFISGGGSALWGAPVDGLDGHTYRSLMQRLVHSGLDISQVNLVRRQVSRLAAGRLASRLHGRKVAALLVSDVPGDDPRLIASGPLTFPDIHETRACGILVHDLATRQVITDDERDQLISCIDNTSADDKQVVSVEPKILYTNRDALHAARSTAIELGYDTVVMDDIVGDARDFARNTVLAVDKINNTRPICMIAAGESTVNVTGNGHGGRNQEMALQAALLLHSKNVNCSILCAGTDGIDGPTDAAGAVVNEDSVAVAAARGKDATSHLEENDAYSFFAGSHEHLITGPTHTNVMDIVIVLSHPSGLE